MTHKPFVKILQIILFLLLSGCVSYNDIEIGDIQNASFKSFDDNVVELAVEVPVSNPNKFGIRIKEINLRTSLNKYYIGKLVCDDVITIPPKSNETHNLNFKLRISNPIQGVLVFFSVIKNDDIKVDIEGYIKFRSLLVSRKIEVKETTVINSFR